MVVCGDEFVVAAAHNAAATDVVADTVDVAAADGVVVGVGSVAAVVVWV